MWRCQAGVRVVGWAQRGNVSTLMVMIGPGSWIRLPGLGNLARLTRAPAALVGATAAEMVARLPTSDSRGARRSHPAPPD